VLAGTDGFEHDDKRPADQPHHRGDVANEIEMEPVIECGVDRVRHADQEQRVTLCGRFRDHLGGDIGTRAWPFSMTNGWPRRSDSHWPSRRAVMSAAPPGGNPTMMRTGHVG